MALQNAPVSIDVTDIQFKLHSKYQVFDTSTTTSQYNDIDLLVAASTFGLIIAGNPDAAELQVIQLNDVVDQKTVSNVPRRSIALPSVPHTIALSCDHTMLTVSYNLNGLCFIDIYSVQSFLSNNIVCILSKVRVSNENNVKVKQLLWNPVISNTLAVCLEDGSLGVYVIKGNNFEYFAIDKSEQARCASWSPKGKQIVVAFPNGKLAQYKPDLKLAKTIPCTVSIYPGPFVPIAVQWLSTYQFAVVFIENKPEAGPALFIVNAPKNVQPTYINYDDICYSQAGPRSSQVFLIHILPWNLILMGSANGTEIGILGTNEAGETPTWKQYIFLDEARAELPLTSDKQDTYPIGLTLETASTHKLTIGENQIPVMPMIHILSTHGFLLSFDLLNFQPTRVDICSPPQPISDRSGIHLYKELSIDLKAQGQSVNTPPTLQQVAFKTPSSNEPQSSNTTFNELLTFNIPENATSTPTKPPINPLQTKTLFGAPDVLASKPTPTNLFTAPTGGLFGNTTPSFGTNAEKPKIETGNNFSSNSFGGSDATSNTVLLKESVKTASVIPTSSANVLQPSVEANKPFLTVESNYAPSAHAVPRAPSNLKNEDISTSESDNILREMILEEIQLFDRIIKNSLTRSRSINISVCTKDECSNLMKNIGELQEITAQATESTDSLKSEVHSLRLSLYEAFAMSAEAQSKFDMLNNPNSGSVQEENLSIGQTQRRQLNNLQALLSQNQARFDVISKQIDAYWSNHLDKVRDNNKARMHIPTLENVYQTLEKQHQILLKEKEKINNIKAKIGVRNNNALPSKVKYNYSKAENFKVNLLIDSVLSMTIGDQIKHERKPINTQKLQKLREATANRKINVIKASRPERKGLNSEVIIEKKLAHAKATKQKEKTVATSSVTGLKTTESKPVQSKTVDAKSFTFPTQPISTAVPSQTQTQTQTKTKSIPLKAALPLSSTGAANVNVFSSLPKPSFGLPTVSTPVFSFNNANKPADKPAALAPIAPLQSQSQITLRSIKPSEKSQPTISTISDTIKTVQPTGISTSNTNSISFTTGNTSLSVTENKNVSFGFSAAQITATTPSANEMNPIDLKTEKKNTLLTSNKENNLNAAQNTEKTKPAFGFGAVKDLSTPFGSTVFGSQATTSANTQQQKPLTVFGQAANSNASIFGTTTITPILQTPIISSVSIKPDDTPVVTKVDSSICAPIAVSPANTVSDSSAQSNSFTFSISSLTSNTGQTKLGNENIVKSQTVSANVIQSPEPIALTAKSPVSTSFSFASAENSNVFGSVPTPSASTTSTASVTTSSDVGSIFKDFNICKPNTSENGNAGTNLFSSTAFGTSNTSVSTPSIFGNTVTGAIEPQISSIFNNKPSSAEFTFGGINLSNTAASSPTTNNSTTNVFGTIPKPDQSVFGTGTPTTSSIFGGSTTTATTTPNVFGTNASSGSIFGQTVSANNNQQQSANVFGGANTFATATSPFGQSPSSKPVSSIFGNAENNVVQSNTAASGGSIFGGTSVFGNANQTPQQQSGGSIFGTGFGGSFSQTANAPSFGSPSAFGNQQQTSNTFQNSSNSPFGQGVPSIAQTGFGSPTNAGFGLNASPASATAPMFGQTPAFGGAATFGSPKSGFGTFANVNTNPSFAAPQQNSLFESLGASENSMTFGNLAQNQNNPAAPKPFGGGSSSFSSWR